MLRSKQHAFQHHKGCSWSKLKKLGRQMKVKKFSFAEFEVATLGLDSFRSPCTVGAQRIVTKGAIICTNFNSPQKFGVNIPFQHISTQFPKDYQTSQKPVLVNDLPESQKSASAHFASNSLHHEVESSAVFGPTFRRTTKLSPQWTPKALELKQPRFFSWCLRVFAMNACHFWLHFHLSSKFMLL